MTTSVHTASQRKQVQQMLCQLSIPIHRIGHYQLLMGIPQFARDPTQKITKDLYPYIMKNCGGYTPQAVEHSIRELIHCAWNQRDREIWEMYFPGAVKVPSNKQFIATLASRLK